MADYLRLRQVCLAAPKLEPVVSDIHDIFGVEVCYRDPNVGAYGLQNALFVIGTNFLEIVSPIQPNTAGGRFIGTGGLTVGSGRESADGQAMNSRTAANIRPCGILVWPDMLTFSQRPDTNETRIANRAMPHLWTPCTM